MQAVARLEKFARAGFLARGIVYILLGYFALATSGGQDATGVLQQIRDMTGGPLLLALVGIGLAGYGIFRLYGAATDVDRDGDDAKGIAKRVGHAASGLAHLLLAYLSFALAAGNGGGGGGGDSGSSAASQTASMPGGDILLALVGLGFIGAAVSQLVKAASGKFMAQLGSRAPGWTEYLGRAGYAARALVFAIIGGQLLSMLFGGAQQVGVEPALNSLRDTRWLFVLVAVGLMLFGIFSLVLARYRRVRDEDMVAGIKGAAAKARR